MSEHLEFEEIVEFLNSSGNGASDLALSEKVNRHIMKCDSCYNVYNTLLEFEELIVFLEDENNRLLRKALMTFPAKALSDKQPVIHKFLKNIHSGLNKVVMKVGDGIELISSVDNYNFMHPALVGVRGGGLPNKTSDKYKLIDDENSYNKISLENTSLVIELDKEEYQHLPIILIVSNTDYSDICQTQEENGKIKAKFEGLQEGQYTIYVD